MFLLWVDCVEPNIPPEYITQGSFTILTINKNEKKERQMQTVLYVECSKTTTPRNSLHNCFYRGPSKGYNTLISFSFKIVYKFE